METQQLLTHQQIGTFHLAIICFSGPMHVNVHIHVRAAQADDRSSWETPFFSVNRRCLFCRAVQHSARSSWRHQVVLEDDLTVDDDERNALRVLMRLVKSIGGDSAPSVPRRRNRSLASVRVPSAVYQEVPRPSKGGVLFVKTLGFLVTGVTYCE